MNLVYLPNARGVQAWFLQECGAGISLEDAERFLNMPGYEAAPWPERLAAMQIIPYDGRICRALAGQLEPAGVLSYLMNRNQPNFPGQLLADDWIRISDQALAEQTALTTPQARDALRQLSAAGAITRAMRPGAYGVCIRVNPDRVDQLIREGERLAADAEGLAAQA